MRITAVETFHVSIPFNVPFVVWRGKLESKPAEIIIYPKAQRGFADPDGGAYDEQAATESWQKTLAFLADNLKSKPR